MHIWQKMDIYLLNLLKFIFFKWTFYLFIFFSFLSKLDFNRYNSKFLNIENVGNYQLSRFIETKQDKINDNKLY